MSDELTNDEKKVLSLYRKLRAHGTGDIRVYVKNGNLDETHVREIEGGEDLALKGVRKLKETQLTDDI